MRTTCAPRRSERLKSSIAGKAKSQGHSKEEERRPIGPNDNKTPTKRRSPAKSPFFQTKSAIKRPKLEHQASSTISFPPLTAKNFGLIQERLHDDSFQLLVAVLFLNRTKGMHSMPVFFALMEQYPTPKDLANASFDDIVEIIRHLGFQNQRAKKLIAFARLWVEEPPQKNRRHRTLNYPNKGDGKNIKAGEILQEEDERSAAFEVAHLPGLGQYAWDSWRIFCRDKLRGLAHDYKGTAAADGFEPEWKRVLPKDKELRPYLRWMWLKEGWDWDPLTGQKRRATQELMNQANVGKLDWHQTGVLGKIDPTVHDQASICPEETIAGGSDKPATKKRTKKGN